VSFLDRSFLCPLATTVLLLGLHGSLTAQSADALTLDEALRLAASRSEQLIAQDAAAAAARHLSIAAGQRPDPMLVAGVENVPVEGADRFSSSRDFMTMRTIGFSGELTRGAKLDARVARFEREAEVADAGHALALADLQRSTAAAWLERHYRERMLAALSGQRREAELEVEAADLAYRNGRGPQSDLFAARSVVAEIDDRIDAAARDVEVATIRLERWIGSAATRSLAEPPPTDAVALDAADLAANLSHHPQIEFMAKEEAVARAAAEVARTEQRADWSVAVMYGARGSAYSDMLTFSVSRPLQWRQGRRQDRELAASLATAERLRAERAEQTRAHVAETRMLLERWRRDRERLDRYTGSLIPLAEERTRAALAAYRAGSGTLGDLIDARFGQIDAHLDRLALELEIGQLWAELNYLVPAATHAGAQGSTASGERDET
jgi:outer membrane protein TolC